MPPATFAAAAVLLSLFFVTSDERFDRVAEWAFVAFAVFAIALCALVQDRLGPSSGVTIVFTATSAVGEGRPSVEDRP